MNQAQRLSEVTEGPSGFSGGMAGVPTGSELLFVDTDVNEAVLLVRTDGSSEVPPNLVIQVGTANAKNSWQIHPGPQYLYSRGLQTAFDVNLKAFGNVHETNAEWQFSEPFKDSRTARITGSLLEIANLPPNWDNEGAEPIAHGIIATAQRVAERSLAVAGEPVIAPAPDGSVLLEWEFPDGTTFDLFVESDDFPGTVVLSMGETIRRIHLTGPQHLEDLLALGATGSTTATEI